MGSSPYLWFFHTKQRLLEQNNKSKGPRCDLSFCTCTTSWVASDLLVSIGPRPHLWFLIAKQRRLVQNYKALRAPDLTCRFVHAKQRD